MSWEVAGGVPPKESVRVVANYSSFRSHASRNNGLPIGVQRLPGGTYRAERCGENLGHFATVDEAADAYRKASGSEQSLRIEYTVDSQFADDVGRVRWHYATKFNHLAGVIPGIGTVFMHRMVWDLCGGQTPEPGQHIDHIDRDPTNNTAVNLRLISHRGNLSNNACCNVRFVPSRAGLGGVWEVRFCENYARWSKRYKDEETARLVAKHRKQMLIDKEVVAYVSLP